MLREDEVKGLIEVAQKISSGPLNTTRNKELAKIRDILRKNEAARRGQRALERFNDTFKPRVS